MSTVTDPHAMTTGAASSGPSPVRAFRRHRAAVWAALLLVAACILGAATVGVTTHARQQDEQHRAEADRTAARVTLDRAVAHAMGDGLDATALRGVTQGEESILAEAGRPSRFGYFDAGEIARVATQAAAIRALVGRVDHIEAVSTDTSRVTAAGVLDQFDAAVSAEQAAGLDPAGDLLLAEQARDTVGRAPSPLAVEAAVAGLGDRAAAIQQQARAKVAADQALAALNNSRSDASAALARGDRLVQQASAFAQMRFQADQAALATQHAAFDTAGTQAQFDAVNGAATDASDHIAALLAARSGAYADMATARQGIQTAIPDKVDPGTVPVQLDALQGQLDGTGTADDFNALGVQIDQLIAPILDRVGVAELGVGKVIVISLDRQSLTAYQDGSAQYTTPITSGRPALPTPPGSYTVVRKNHPWLMVSDFPRSSPYWYAPSLVQWTLWFRNDGYAIHDAPWRSTYGPGTDAFGSHGCVNVPMPIMAALFAWAEVGTRVIVK